MAREGGGEKNFIYIFGAYICCSTATSIVRIQFRSSIRFVLTCFFFLKLPFHRRFHSKVFFSSLFILPQSLVLSQEMNGNFQRLRNSVCATQKNSLCFATISENGKVENAKKILCKKEHIQYEPSSCLCLTLAHSMAFCVCVNADAKETRSMVCVPKTFIDLWMFFSCFSILFIFFVFSIERKTEQKINIDSVRFGK